VSGPARRPASAPRTARPEETLADGLLGRLRGLADHRLLDRLTRGRFSIALVAFALIGIVTLQLALLKLNAGIGRSLEHSARLQRENAALSIENSGLAAGNGVEAGAGSIGMQLIPISSLKFLSSARSDLAKASTALSSTLHAGLAEGEATATSTSASTTATGAEASSTATGAEESSSAAGGEAPSTSTAAPSSSAGSSAPAGETAPSTTGTPSAAAGEGTGEAAQSGGMAAPTG
jgi:hypothetical protein